ncbi:unnamed protein product [Closterium sp. NIES-54]
MLARSAPRFVVVDLPHTGWPALAGPAADSFPLSGSSVSSRPFSLLRLPPRLSLPSPSHPAPPLPRLLPFSCGGAMMTGWRCPLNWRLPGAIPPAASCYTELSFAPWADPSPYKGPRPVLLPPAPSPAVTVSCPTVCAIPGPGQPQVPLALHSQPPVQPPPPLRLHPPPTQASSSLQQPSSASVPKLPSPSMAPSVSSGPISVQAPDLPPMWASLLAPPLPPSSSTPSSAVPQPLAPPHFQLPPSAPCTDPPVVSPILAAPPASVGDQGLQ